MTILSLARGHVCLSHDLKLGGAAHDLAGAVRFLGLDG